MYFGSKYDNTFRNFVLACIAIGLVFGAIAAAVVFLVIPMAWEAVKPVILQVAS